MKIFLLILLALFLLNGCGETSSSSENSPAPAPVAPQLSRSLLVVELNYNDIEFTDSDPSVWADKIFGMSEGQLNHYYMQISKKQFRFLPVKESNGVTDDGVMSVKLNKNHPNPGNNFYLLHPDFKEALIKLDDEIDFAQFDRDRNGYISSKELLIVFIVAGNEEAYGPSQLPGVFAHQFCIKNDDVPYLDSVSLMACSAKGNYAVFGERHDNNKRNATIGIIAHELGHAAFSLPDLYDTTPSAEPDSAGIGYFGLMSAGMWGTKEPFQAKEGSSPAHMCAWSKIQNGWVTPEVINPGNLLHVRVNESSAESYNVIKIPINSSEYLLLENRNNSGYDRGLKAIGGIFNGGLAVWKIDENVINSHMATNTVNAEKESKGVALIEATHPVLDKSSYEHGHEKNLFYYENRSSYSEDSVIIRDISSRGESMSAVISTLN